jgi:hypothetical protein
LILSALLISRYGTPQGALRKSTSSDARGKVRVKVGPDVEESRSGERIKFTWSGSRKEAELEIERKLKSVGCQEEGNEREKESTQLMRLEKPNDVVSLVTWQRDLVCTQAHDQVGGKPLNSELWERE